jgi:hypothetical protein
MERCFSSALLIVALVFSCQNKPHSNPPDIQDTAPLAAQPDDGASRAAVAEAGSPDSIGKVEAYIKESPAWTNGLSPKINLPASARPEEVLAALLKKASFDKGKVTSPKIVATRAIATSSSGDNPYTAVHFESEQGNYVIVMRHEGVGTGWWTKTFDPEKLGPPSK